MFDHKVEKILQKVRHAMTQQANTINLFQRIVPCESKEKTRLITEMLSLLTDYQGAAHTLHLDLRENDLSIENIKSLAHYNGNRIEVDLSSNYLVIRSEADEQIWQAIARNPCLNLTPGWQQPVDARADVLSPGSKGEVDSHK